MICMSYCFCCRCTSIFRIPRAMRPDDATMIVALNVKPMLSWAVSWLTTGTVSRLPKVAD